MKYLTKLAAILVAGVAFVGHVHAQKIVAPDAVLVANSRAKVTYEDLIAELERLPEENRLEFLLSAQRVSKIVENILIGKIMSAEAQQSGLQNRPNVAAEIRNQTERVLAKYRREFCKPVRRVRSPAVPSMAATPMPTTAATPSRLRSATTTTAKVSGRSL